MDDGLNRYKWTPEQIANAERILKGSSGAWMRYGDHTTRCLVTYDPYDDCYEANPWGGDTGPIGVELEWFDPASISAYDTDPLSTPATATPSDLSAARRTGPTSAGSGDST
jgi:hypothetical protein